MRNIWFLIALIAILAGIWILFRLKQPSPQKILNLYYDAMINREYEKAYAFLSDKVKDEIPLSKFLKLNEEPFTRLFNQLSRYEIVDTQNINEDTILILVRITNPNKIMVLALLSRELDSLVVNENFWEQIDKEIKSTDLSYSYEELCEAIHLGIVDGVGEELRKLAQRDSLFGNFLYFFSEPFLIRVKMVKEDGGWHVQSNLSDYVATRELMSAISSLFEKEKKDLLLYCLDELETIYWRTEDPELKRDIRTYLESKLYAESLKVLNFLVNSIDSAHVNIVNIGNQVVFGCSLKIKNSSERYGFFGFAPILNALIKLDTSILFQGVLPLLDTTLEDFFVFPGETTMLISNSRVRDTYYWLGNEASPAYFAEYDGEEIMVYQAFLDVEYAILAYLKGQINEQFRKIDSRVKQSYMQRNLRKNMGGFKWSKH